MGDLAPEGRKEARLVDAGLSRTWLLKSQYGHFDRQNGQCT